ncbi:hypothetical protein ANCCAN_29903, partial [Ancylostoma caninum]
MRLLLNLLLLLFPSFVLSIELNIENETEFWSDILNYADSVGVRRSVLATLLRLDPDVAVAGGKQDENPMNFLDIDSGTHGETSVEHDKHAHGSHGVKVASFKFDYVKEPLVLTMFIIVIGIFKL